MITGNVHSREALVELEVSGQVGQTQRIAAVIDTGYNGYPTLPKETVAALDLPFAGHRRGRLADGSTTLLDVYLVTVTWHGRAKLALISQTSGAPLVGMALLQGSRLTMDVRDGGDVMIEEFPR